MKNILIIVLGVFVLGTAGYLVIEKKSNGNGGSVKTQSDSGTNTSPQNTLNLSGQGLTKVSMDVFSRTSATELNLSHNSLEGSLPSQVGQLKNLRVLNLSYNNFTGVPAEIGQLKYLEVLNLSHNSLTGLPNELGNLSNLRLLDLSGNNYSEQDLAGIKSRLPATTIIKTQ